jgi:hypothetical protein
VDRDDVRGVFFEDGGLGVRRRVAGHRPPLAFSMRYEALRVRLSLNAIGESPARLDLTPPSGARAVSDLARGKLGVSE